MFEILGIIFEGWEGWVLIGAVALGARWAKQDGNLKDEYKD
jgi:hypothetical protein